MVGYDWDERERKREGKRTSQWDIIYNGFSYSLLVYFRGQSKGRVEVEYNTSVHDAMRLGHQLWLLGVIDEMEDEEPIS